MDLLPIFKSSPGTIGVELEWQLIDPLTLNLSPRSQEFITLLENSEHPGELKPEITLGMIEFNSSIHRNYSTLLQELRDINNIAAVTASKMNLAICGGGSHPFQRWQEQIIFPAEPFKTDYDKFGYLAKQYTVFGQHIHIGCQDGDEAIYLCHAMARYIPQLIVLAASSPFYLGEDTHFDSTRINTISVFPLSGHLALVSNWDEFEKHVKNLCELKIIENVSDLNWDIRLKPELGTIEIRICDSPLTIDTAARLVIYAKLLAMHLLNERNPIHSECYLPYAINRFNAAKQGFYASVIDMNLRSNIPITEDIIQTCTLLEPYAEKMECREVLEYFKKCAQNKVNDASWLREKYKSHLNMNEVVNNQINLWSDKSYLMVENK